MTKLRNGKQDQIRAMNRTLLIVLLAIVVRDGYTGDTALHWLILLAVIVIACIYTSMFLLRTKESSNIQGTSTMDFKMQTVK